MNERRDGYVNGLGYPSCTRRIWEVALLFYGKGLKKVTLSLLFTTQAFAALEQPPQGSSAYREWQRAMTFQQLIKYDALNTNQHDWVTHLLSEQHEMISLFQKYSLYSEELLANRIEAIFEVTEAKIFTVLDGDQQDMWRHQRWLVERIPVPRRKPSKMQAN